MPEDDCSGPCEITVVSTRLVGGYIWVSDGNFTPEPTKNYLRERLRREIHKTAFESMDEKGCTGDRCHCIEIYPLQRLGPGTRENIVITITLTDASGNTGTLRNNAVKWTRSYAGSCHKFTAAPD